ncbi:MAG: flagellar basal-body rod protein FlgF [Desulfobacteraceae bacterium]|nr:MAG: flagellar basal-body rod protein FlgF [Desulfobacteraceae bacterium]
MSEAIYTATSGALAYQMRLEVLSNNLSNINTVGFKQDRTVFRTYLPGSQKPITETLQTPPTSEAPGTLAPCQTSNSLVAFEGTRTDFSPGQLRHTGNALDLAIDGNGFFCIQTQEGVQYTRKGNFTINREGILITPEGFPVLGEGGEIKIDGQDYLVDEEGNISVDGIQIDTFKIVNFTDPQNVKKVGNTLFAPAGSSFTEEKAEQFKVSQGFIELSNVDAIKVMTEMIEVLRGFESYKKVIQSIDEVTSKAIDKVGGIE